MTGTPIKVVNEFLPDKIFSNLAYQLMMHAGYKCNDFTVDSAEADGSIAFFGQKEPEGNIKLHESLFTFPFYKRLEQSEWIEDFYHKAKEELTVLYEALNVKQMFLLRANCTTALPQNHISKFHTDMTGHIWEDKFTTAILYLNTNNGGTQFESGEFVKSQANTLVKFPATKNHAGVWCTDRKLRFVLNINYIEN